MPLTQQQSCSFLSVDNNNNDNNPEREMLAKERERVYTECKLLHGSCLPATIRRFKVHPGVFLEASLMFLTHAYIYTQPPPPLPIFVRQEGMFLSLYTVHNHGGGGGLLLPEGCPYKTGDLSRWFIRDLKDVTNKTKKAEMLSRKVRKTRKVNELVRGKKKRKKKTNPSRNPF